MDFGVLDIHLSFHKMMNFRCLIQKCFRPVRLLVLCDLDLCLGPSLFGFFNLFDLLHLIFVLRFNYLSFKNFKKFLNHLLNYLNLEFRECVSQFLDSIT